jgi:hypothetical protein
MELVSGDFVFVEVSQLFVGVFVVDPSLFDDGAKPGEVVGYLLDLLHPTYYKLLTRSN